MSRRCRGGVEAVSIDTGVNGVEACRPCRLSVGGRIDSLYAYGVSKCRLCRVSECRACRSVSERVERVECVKCVECSSRHHNRRRQTVVGGPSLSLSLLVVLLGWQPTVSTHTHTLSLSLSVSLSLTIRCRRSAAGSSPRALRCAPGVRWVIVSSSYEMLCMLDVSIVLSSIRHSGMSSEI